jgi:hypothetical protein
MSARGREQQRLKEAERGKKRRLQEREREEIFVSDLYKSPDANDINKNRDPAAHLVGSEEDGAEEAAVDGALVHHQRVLLVVARVARDGHNRVDA